jgi:lysyl-tRNA synthetase class 2
VEEAVAKYTPGFDVKRARDVAYLRETLTQTRHPVQAGRRRGQAADRAVREIRRGTIHRSDVRLRVSTEVSPLSAMNDQDPFLTDRFEFFIAVARSRTASPSSTTPRTRRARFKAQVERKEAGDDEAMYYDADYVRALEYGMPPTAGLGVGIDRLVMFFTDSPSIRDVLLFPHMRPESG